MEDTQMTAPNPHKWNIGIDFGTSNTYIVGYDEANDKYHDWRDKFEKANLSWFGYGIPTVVTVDRTLKYDPTKPLKEPEQEDQFLYGKAAIVHPFLKLERSLKTKIRTTDPSEPTPEEIEFGNADSSYKVTAEALLENFFSAIFTTIEIKEVDINHITIGCPCKSIEIKGKTYTYEDALKNALARCFGFKDATGWNKVTVMTEPELASLAYFCGTSDYLKEEDLMLVVDSGGGTTDFSLLYQENGEPKTCYLVHEGDGIPCQYAGNEFDKALQAHIKAAWGIDVTTEFCQRAKESFFIEPLTGNASKDPKDKKFGLPKEGEILCWEEKDRARGVKVALEDPCQKIAEYLKNALEKEGNEGKSVLSNRKINKVFFVGGSTYVKPLRDTIQNLTQNNSYFADKVHFINAYDQNIEVKLDGLKGVTITGFNAIALGACINSFGGAKEMIVFPNIQFQWAGGGDSVTFYSRERDGVLVIKEPKEERYIYSFTIDENSRRSFSLGTAKCHFRLTLGEGENKIVKSIYIILDPDDKVKIQDVPDNEELIVYSPGKKKIQVPDNEELIVSLSVQEKNLYLSIWQGKGCSENPRWAPTKNRDKKLISGILLNSKKESITPMKRRK